MTFRESFSVSELVKVWLGRIRVQIEHRNGPNYKSVSTPTALISVRGTVFDVVVEDEDSTTLVSVEEGLVDVQHLLQAGPAIRLHRGESIRVYPASPLARLVDRTPVVRGVLNAARDAIYQVLMQRNSGGGVIPGGGSSSGGTTQGDKGKSGSGGTTTAPGAPSSTTTAPGGTSSAPGPPTGGGE